MPELQARSVLAEATRVVVFTGAGISAESGVPTFRGPGGLWKEFKPEDLATADAFARNPKLVWEWYSWRRGLVAGCRPNAAHTALAAWMRSREGVTLVTQNVDDLHERAGTPALIKLHGSLFKDRCNRCDYTRDAGPAAAYDPPPVCPGCGAPLRPDVVWFGEMLPEEELVAAEHAAVRAEACLVIGTSGAVYPAAGIVHAAREGGARLIVVDPGETEYDRMADIRLTGKAGELVPPLFC